MRKIAILGGGLCAAWLAVACSSSSSNETPDTGLAGGKDASPHEDVVTGKKDSSGTKHDAARDAAKDAGNDVAEGTDARATPDGGKPARPMCS